MAVGTAGYRLFVCCLWACLLAVAPAAHAQEYTVAFLGKNDLHKANHFYKEKNYEEAVKLYYTYFSHREAPLKAQLAIADALKHLYRTPESENWYRKIPALPEDRQLDFAEVLIMNGKVHEAHAGVSAYLAQHPGDARATLLLKETTQYASFYKDSLQYSIQPYAGNSLYADYAPVYYKNDLVFCSSRPTDGLITRVAADNHQPLSHLFTAAASNDRITPFHAFRHASGHDGPVTFWDQDSKAVYGSNSDKLFEKGKLSLYYSEYAATKKAWSKSQALSFVDRRYSYGHPFFDTTQQALYFVSDMPGGYGGTDLYRSYWKGAQWSSPENLGALINTAGHEMYPFVSKDQVLYFASNGHAGMGGLDLYASKTDSNDTYLYNLGYPVNSAFDDFSLVLTDSSRTGLFSSNRNGNDDLFHVKIYKIDWQLEVSDQLQYKPLVNCLVKVLEEESGETKHVLHSNKNGTVHCALVPGKNYTIKIYKNGYAMKSIAFVEQDREKKSVQQRISIARTHQRYVKVKIMQGKELIRNSDVQLMDYATDTVMSYKADSSGSFLCPINSDTTALLSFTKGDGKAYAFFEKDVDARENSGISYLTVQLEDTITTHLVQGRCQAPDSSVVPHATLYCRNRMTRQVQTIQTDDAGSFTAALEAFGLYDVYANEELSKPLVTVDAAVVRFMEVTLRDQK
ncbi:MAG: Minor outer membrane protein Omp16 [Chitinophagaceae bacterium]|nr:Minor outer membrane protein Omp16 [Chitinophagaceae bacterium]